jgi:glycine/D-amino acid oxidase-like deaminating enzyme
VQHNGEVSYWYRQTGMPARRRPLEGDRDADVCIVGAGFTGLWTAYYLKQAQPDLEIVVIEREFAGFGASGRNGGWVSDHSAGSREVMAKSHGRDAVLALQREMRKTVDEVLAVCAREGIAADLVKSGKLIVARNSAQDARLDAFVAYARDWGDSPEDVALLQAGELEKRIHIAGARRAVFSPHAARAQAARLVTGLAAAAERLGVKIFEGTAVKSLHPRVVTTTYGQVRARSVLACLEGYNAQLEGHRRLVLPLNSAMVVTTPLSNAQWHEIGWGGNELVSDGAHSGVYVQRTSDGRIALGGRGVPYRFGSRTDKDGETQQETIKQLIEALHSIFPAAAGADIDHAWCGVLGVHRDWIPRVTYDRTTGLGSAGGYVGSGVAGSNLAGRVLRDLVVEKQSELTRLPWVRARTRKWEPEPLRWAGARLVFALYRAADRRESVTGQESNFARCADLISGR